MCGICGMVGRNHRDIVVRIVRLFSYGGPDNKRCCLGDREGKRGICREGKLRKRFTLFIYKDWAICNKNLKNNFYSFVMV